MKAVRILFVILYWLMGGSFSLAQNSGNFSHEINPDGLTVTLMGFTGPGTIADIPASIEGKSVTSIGSGAFVKFIIGCFNNSKTATLC